MGVSYNSYIPTGNGIISLIDAANSKHTDGNPASAINDQILGTTWSRNSVTDSIEDGIKCFDINSTGPLQCSSSVTLPQSYTLFYLLKWRTSDSGWRTLHRGNSDHWVIVNNGAKDLGIYSNRSGAFRDSGYDILVEWQTLIVTGVGDSPVSNTGTSTFYINGNNVGTADRVACGTSFYGIGWSGQSPGYISVAGALSGALSTNEIKKMHETLAVRI